MLPFSFALFTFQVMALKFIAKRLMSAENCELILPSGSDKLLYACALCFLLLSSALWRYIAINQVKSAKAAHKGTIASGTAGAICELSNIQHKRGQINANHKQAHVLFNRKVLIVESPMKQCSMKWYCDTQQQIDMKFTSLHAFAQRQRWSIHGRHFDGRANRWKSKFACLYIYLYA